MSNDTRSRPMTAEQKTETVHTCSYECDRPECVRAQRDELRDRMESALDQQPAAVGEEIMVNAAHGVYTLPLQPSGLSSGPRFVVHVPGPEQPAGVEEISEDDIATIAWQAGFYLEKEDAEGEPTEDWQWLDSEGENMFPDLVKFARKIAALAAQPGGAE